MAENEQQSNIRIEKNIAYSGLNLDQTANQIPKGKLTYALNAAVENFDANSVNYQNEPGNELCLNFPEGYHIIGNHFIPEQNKHVFFLVNPETGDSEIGYMDNNDCVYHTFINAPCLNFDVRYPIHKAVHKITNCTTEVYWPDHNGRRFIDLNNPPYKIVPGSKVCDDKTTTEIDCNKLRVQPNFSIPELKVVEVINGGGLTAGTVQFAIQYCDVAGDAYTSYYSVTNPTPIANTHITTPDFNYPVGKSVVLDVTNIDTTGYYQYYNLAVIKNVNNITSVELIGTYFIDGASKRITYSGQNQTQIKLTVNDIFEKYPYYDIADDVTAVQDVIVWKGLTTVDRVSYQKIANQIKLQWETWRVPSTENYANESVATNLTGYLRDEVYAFEICFLLDNGKQTDGFHIPGRSYTVNDIVAITSDNPDFIGTPDPLTNSLPKWKIYNTASALGTSPQYNSNSSYKGPYQYGEFAYWESEEKYPCNEEIWGDLSDKPIRHHKFPDVKVSPIFENPVIQYSSNGTYAPVMVQDAIFPIGVKIDVAQIQALIYSSSLTQSQKDSIVGFKILRGNRATNKSIVAKGILRNVGAYNREGTNYYFPNYPYNDIKKDPFLLEKNNAYVSISKNYRVKGINGVTPSAATIQYTDIFTNTIATKTIGADDTEIICSLTTPETTSGYATIEVADYQTYVLTALSSDPILFSYDPYTPSDGNGSIWAYINNPVTVRVKSGTTPVSTQLPQYWKVTTVPNSTYSPCYPSNLDAFSSDGSKYRYVFNSPETSFGSPYLGNVLKLESAIFGAGKGHFVEVKKNATYRLLTKEAQQDALASSQAIANITGTLNPAAMFAAYQSYLTIYINGITRRNFGYSYNSIASYDYYADIDNEKGIKQRELDLAQYLIPSVQSAGDDRNINNYNRESSVYLKTKSSVAPLPFPSKTDSLVKSNGESLIEDNSRFTISEKGNCAQPAKQFDITTVTYYASLKNQIVNQWGQMYSYETIDTGAQVLFNNIPSQLTVFGGDTFINRFSFKTKLPFFIDNRVNAPDDSDVFYDEIGNVAYPQYWHSSRSILSDYNYGGGSPAYMKNIFSVKAHCFDCPNSQLPATDPTTEPPVVNPNRTFYDGKMYMFAYGIPTFYCESSINVDLRQAFNNREGDFFPHVTTDIPDDWVQESYVPIVQDNTYYYNPSFSKQNKENYFSHLPVNWKGELCYTNFPFRAIYSDRQQSYTDNRINSWLIYRPISFFDFPQNYGKFISVDGIQNRAVLTRFENKSLLYNTLLTIDTSNPQAAYMGNDTLFRSAPPIDFAETDLGYVGAQHKMLLKIPQGQITIDAKRGQVFLIAGGESGGSRTAFQAMDLSAFGSGLNRFFTDHLAFEILRYFPNANVDNHFNGLGLHGVYDSKYDRVIISKLDYIPVNQDVKYDETLQKFYVDIISSGISKREYVSLTDTNYFCNKSWTLSYNVNTQSWISFHSYIPNFYIAENNFFYSGLNGGCDLEAIAAEEVPLPTTTTTTTIYHDCTIIGTARQTDCTLDGSADLIEGPTTTTTTTTTTTAYVPNCLFYGTAQQV